MPKGGVNGMYHIPCGRYVATVMLTALVTFQLVCRHLELVAFQGVCNLFGLEH